MNILCNTPLECFDDRAAFHQRVVTFGPAAGKNVHGDHYPFDVAFDPSRGTVAELFARLPRDFAPDLLLLYWPDQEPLPDGLAQCPVPVVGVFSDYNLSLQYIAGLWPLFDVLLVDRAGVDLFQRLSFADVRPFCQFSFKAPYQWNDPAVERDVDIAFAGNLNPACHAPRNELLHRLAALRHHGVRVEIRTQVEGHDYRRLLNRAKLGFNRSVRGEMNLRSFEVPACGALLLCEHDNAEIRDFLIPECEVALYRDDDLEDVVLALLADEPRRARMAAAGHARVQDHRMRNRLDDLERLLATTGPGRPVSTPFEQHLARGVAMLATWADPAAMALALRPALAAQPDDPRALNAMALAILADQRPGTLDAGTGLLRRACAVAPHYVPAAANLTTLVQAAGQGAEAKQHRSALEHRLAAVRGFADLDGPQLPFGFNQHRTGVARALAAAVRAGDPSSHLQAWMAPA